MDWQKEITNPSFYLRTVDVQYAFSPERGAWQLTIGIPTAWYVASFAPDAMERYLHAVREMTQTFWKEQLDTFENPPPSES